MRADEDSYDTNLDRDGGSISSDDADKSTATLAEPAARKSPSPTARRPGVASILLGRYEILDELGHGGMGVVYRARDQQLGRDVAIKLVRTGDDPHDTLAARLLREAQALARLSHPNVVAVYDVGRAEGGVFVAMELVSGVAADIWLRDKPPWRDVLRVFLDAARGLAAAHAVGLIHRDFKPANLILGSDGRTRVLDFGLARAATYGSTIASSSGEIEVEGVLDAAAELDDLTGRVTEKLGANEVPRAEAGRARRPSGPERSHPSPSPSRPTSSGTLLDSPLTEIGAIVGTPQYMAPEQHLRAPCDARTDQFSFCVSLYRALYGQRPFGGTRYAELKNNVFAGKVLPPPAETDVPAWLRDVVLRGLEVDPANRWPSMDALIAALSRDADARRRKLIAGAAAVALAAGGFALWHVTRPDPAASCAVGSSELAGVWDTARKHAVQATFTKTAAPYAADAFATVSRTLDDYTSRWAAMRTDACLATRVRGTQSAELLDLRMACLDRRRDAVRALVDVLASADVDVTSRAARAATALPTLDGCADSEALRAPIRPPADPQTVARVDAAHKTLAKVRALWMAGRYKEARALATPLIADAHAIGYRPLEGEALLQGARIADDSGDYPAATKLFKEAAIAAEAGRDDETAVLARNGVVWVVGERLGHYDEAKELARDAQAKIERLGHNDRLQADLDQKLAALALAQGDYKLAEQHSRRVLETRRRVLAPDDLAIAVALGDLGDVETQTTRYDDAIAHYKAALAIAERAGRDHPFCAGLRINLATAYRGKGENREALAELAKARTISERALGPGHAQLATIAINIGGIKIDENLHAEATPELIKARDIWTKALGADHPNVATAEFRLGEVALHEGRATDAIASFQRAHDIWSAKLGPEHPSLSAALTGLGDAALAQHKPAAALAYYSRALALLEKALGADNPMLADTLTSLSNARLALGKPATAVASLERALKLREAEGDKLGIARGQFALARALPRSAAKRAVALATRAHATLAATPATAREAKPIQQWLDAHRK